MPASISSSRGDDPRHEEVLPVDVRPPKVAIGIFTLKNRTIGAVARLFVDYAREGARPLSRIRDSYDVRCWQILLQKSPMRAASCTVLQLEPWPTTRSYGIDDLTRLR